MTRSHFQSGLQLKFYAWSLLARLRQIPLCQKIHIEKAKTEVSLCSRSCPRQMLEQVLSASRQAKLVIAEWSVQRIVLFSRHHSSLLPLAVVGSKSAHTTTVLSTRADYHKYIPVQQAWAPWGTEPTHPRADNQASYGKQQHIKTLVRTRCPSYRCPSQAKNKLMALMHSLLVRHPRSLSLTSPLQSKPLQSS